MEVERLKYLADLDVMSWKDGDMTLAICEGSGPLVVRHANGDVVHAYPWHCVHKVTGLQSGRVKLYVLDVLRNGSVVGVHEAGTWAMVGYEPRFRVIFPKLPRARTPRVI